MADAPDLGSGAARRGGSSPPSRIIRISFDLSDIYDDRLSMRESFACFAGLAYGFDAGPGICGSH
jgi:hypothetical protein